MNPRQARALDIVTSYKANRYELLGEGKSSVVFTCGTWVYKVFLLDKIAALSYKKLQLQALESRLSVFDHSDYFYPIKSITAVDNDVFILMYPFEPSEPCTELHTEELFPFLVECWQKRIVFQDIKPENFVRVKGLLKWIDYEPDKFTDNLFLNMATRAFVYCLYPNESEVFVNKLCRSAINQFQLPELEGLQAFMNKVYTSIIYHESSGHFPSAVPSTELIYTDEIITNTVFTEDELTLTLPYSDTSSTENLFWNFYKKGYYLHSIDCDTPFITSENYFTPKHLLVRATRLKLPVKKVSMVIKACIQDAEVVYHCVQHIVKQTASPNVFDEIILALDSKESDFLRQYSATGTWEMIICEANKLLADGIITKIIYPHSEDIKRVNQKWFQVVSTATHTEKKVPVGAQLFAFEQAKNDFVFQLDCDVMMGRLNYNHSFLNDMISAIENDENVVSVGFNIYKGKAVTFTPYFGYEQGGFVPEVRCCLLKKSRIDAVLPLSNTVTEKGFELSWYRALEKKQKETNTCSIRGGDSQSFFIHPQNYKKMDTDLWFTTLNAVEQLHIPEIQINQFDVAGSYYDWCGVRKEDLVVVSCFRNLSLPRFLRFWYSLISQENQNWGLILIDDASENRLTSCIKTIIAPYKNRVTFLSNRQRMGVAHNTHKAIHYCITNPEAIVTILDADDALLGRKSLKNVFEKFSYNDADVVIGKMYRTDKLTAHYPYTPNFVNPRLYGGNVWQHLRSFKKYLYDSLDVTDLKIPFNSVDNDSILLSKRFSKQWVYPEHCWDFAYMVPIVEMAQNPMWINHFNVVHDRTTVNTPEIKLLKENEIKLILAKPPKNTKDVVHGRKTFLPNLKKIEIDITYECNLKCINCNRSSTQAPIQFGMQLSQIIDFVNESITLHKKWELINILGGEPTLHSNFQEIVLLILEAYIIPFSPSTILQITSNGFGEHVNEQLNSIPKHPNIIIDYASFKEERIVPYFSPFNDAPIDAAEQHSEYHKGCWVTSYCGIGLNQLGYYPCGVAGGIDRVFELQLGIPHLKDVDASISELLTPFCQLCGNFTDYEKNKGNFIPRSEKAAVTTAKISETWRKQYKKYNGK